MRFASSIVAAALSAVATVAVLGVLSGTWRVPDPAAAAAIVPTGASSFVPLASCRVADTRLAPSPDTYTRVGPTTVRVRVADVCSVPADATAVSVTVTATDVKAGGFVTTWPSGKEMPVASNLNVVGGDTRSNGTVVTVGAGRAIDVFSSAPADVIVDLNGAFVPSAATTSGRFVPIVPQRIVDTRPDRVVPRNGSLTVVLPPSVPEDAIAVVVNLTVTESAGPGFLTAHAAGSVRPLASVLTTSAPGQTRAATSIVPVSAAGFTIFSSSGAHVVVDLTGFFTGASGALSTDGLFVAVLPTRMIDTRVVPPRIYRNSTIEIDPHLAGASSIVANWTMVDAAAAGFMTVNAAGTPRGTTSSVNASGPGEVVANLGFAPLSTRGIAIYSSAGAHLVADVVGWFTGSPVVAVLDRPSNVPAGPQSAPPVIDDRLAYIGDSLTINDLGSGLQSSLDGLGWDARIDGLPSRNIAVSKVATGLRAVADLKANGFDPQKWVIALGTNDIDKTCPMASGWDKSSCFRTWVGQMLTAIGPGTDVLWVNAYRADSPAFVVGTDDFDHVLREYETDGRLRVIDFLSWARMHPADFRDNIHLFTIELCRLRIRLITEAITANFGQP